MILDSNSKKSINYFYNILMPKLEKDKHLLQYNYDKSVYKTTRDKIIVTCKCHGDFKIRLSSLLEGDGCMKCGTLRTQTKLVKTQTTFSEQVKELPYDFSKAVYLNARTKLEVVCKEHGSFWITPNKLLTNITACRKCGKKTGFDKDKPAMLYYLSIDGGSAYKIGITNHSVEQRFYREDLSRFKIIATYQYDNGREAFLREQKILKEFKYAKYNGVALLENGNTELFNHDVLGLDCRKENI